MVHATPTQPSTMVLVSGSAIANVQDDGKWELFKMDLPEIRLLYLNSFSLSNCIHALIHAFNGPLERYGL